MAEKVVIGPKGKQPPAMTNEELFKKVQERLLRGLEKPDHIKAANEIIETLRGLLLDA